MFWSFSFVYRRNLFRVVERRFVHLPSSAAKGDFQRDFRWRKMQNVFPIEKLFRRQTSFERTNPSEFDVENNTVKVKRRNVVFLFFFVRSSPLVDESFRSETTKFDGNWFRSEVSFSRHFESIERSSFPNSFRTIDKWFSLRRESLFVWQTSNEFNISVVDKKFLLFSTRWLTRSWSDEMIFSNSSRDVSTDFGLFVGNDQSNVWISFDPSDLWRRWTFPRNWKRNSIQRAMDNANRWVNVFCVHCLFFNLFKKNTWSINESMRDDFPLGKKPSIRRSFVISPSKIKLTIE